MGALTACLGWGEGMLTQLFNDLQGQVDFQVTCPFPERVLNLCSARGLRFWNVVWMDDTSFSCTMGRRDFYRLRSTAKTLDATLHLQKKRGIPFFLGRFRHRQVLVYSALVAAAFLVWSPFFIWDFTVYGNDTVSETAILRALQEQGVTIGSFGLAVDSVDLRNHVLVELPELSWIAVNVSGCRAYVQVQERVMAPELQLRNTPSNVVATQDGLVLWVNALDGQAMALKGTMVTQGQLLIAGISDIAPYGAQIRTGLGTVSARTWHAYSTNFPSVVEKKGYTGEESTQWSVILGRKRINFFVDSSNWGANYDKIIKTTQWTLFGLPLPISTISQTICPYTNEEVTLDAQMVQALACEILEPYLRTQLSPDGSVSSSLCQVRQTDSGWSATLQAECVEQIGKTVPIYTDEHPQPLE